jgi:type II secretory pathway pseudopilin PulG
MRLGRPHRTRPSTGRRGEAGETLVEILITVAIVGIGVVTIMGAIWTALRVADYHRKTTNADVVLRNFAEAMQEKSGTFQYKPCATLTGANAYPTYTPVAPDTDHHPATYQATITKIEYLTGYTAGNDPTWQNSTSGCPGGGDQGAQRITLKVDGPTNDPQVRGVETVTIVKRDARGES